MTPERWQQVKGIFQQALEQETGRCAEYLDEACAGDAELRREVESLLHSDQGTTNPLDAPLSQLAASLIPTEQGSPMIGRRIGVYRLTGLIGQGGMGAVYAAVRDDDQYRQKVAIKLVKTELLGGGVNADPALQRFRRERQILARLEHPNIARLLDGGATPEGWPYLVMEYIEGQPLTEFCETHNLTVVERLELFRAVCAAVQQAHQNLIIHRDLKPSNILVTKDGTAKLLDFGIAKLLNPELVTDGGFTDLAKTATAMRVMTPDYASPEQARGEAVTTATDVYSLGVVLYELLTGVRPHQFKGHSFIEIEHAICDVEPMRPSDAARQNPASLKLSKQLEGDLDNIILMALRKEPARRYQSAEQFSEDIRRHLCGLPVIARQDTIRYRAGKFARRHRWGVAATTAIALLLIGSAAFSGYQARRAERRFQQVRKLANTFLFEFDGKIQNITGTTEARELLVKTALEYLDSLAKEAGDDAELQYELATAYAKVADVQGNPRMNNLGHTAEALVSCRKALDLAQALLSRSPQNSKYQRLLAELHSKQGHIYYQTGAYTEALAAHQREVAILEPLTFVANALESDLNQLMIGYRSMGDLEVEWVPALVAGINHYRKALEIAERRAAAFPSDLAQYQLAVQHSVLAYALIQQGDPQTSIKESEASLALFEPLAVKHPNEAPYQNSLFIAYQHLGMAQGQPLGVNLNDTTTALQTFAKMQIIPQRLISADPKNQRAQDCLVVGLILIGETEAVKEPARGTATLLRALEELHAPILATGDPFRYRLLQHETLTWLAEAENRQGQTAISLKHLREAQTIWQTLVAEQPDEFSVKAQNCDLQQILAEVLQTQGDFDGAVAALREALKFAEAEKASKPEDVRALWRLADCYKRFGQYQEALARQTQLPDERRAAWQQAFNWYQKSLQLWNDWPRFAVPSVFSTTRRESVAQSVTRCFAQLKR
ncbi:MAG: serine/threonine protein kinase [Acidobacteria bacterium]|nr:serine/threonine protein kinase [Acidobacteriota bacterium]